MRIVIASGKGGTGKTTIATSLALALTAPLRFLDCDVEAPNAALFLHPLIEQRQDVGILLPVINEELCNFCGRCAEVCEFHAIAVIGKKTLVFPELCHGCGSCTRVCPEKAIHERLDVMGVLEAGPVNSRMVFAQGVMNIGEPMAVPIIRQLKTWLPVNPDVIEIRDSPPGASCPVVETIRGADFVLLVTEPTPFGLHDLKGVVTIVRDLHLPAGVVINRDGIGNNSVQEYCVENNLPILLRIPNERRFAEAIASGRTLVEVASEYLPDFQNMFAEIKTRVSV